MRDFPELDRPIWSALTSLQANVAQTHGRAIRFDPEVTSLAAFAPGHAADAGATDVAFADLAALLHGRELAGVLLDAEPAQLPPALRRVDALAATQMLHTDPAACAAAAVPPPAYVTLGAADVPEMVDLARRTKPGPFADRSHTLGTFLGVRDPDGKLAAMAGQRMRLPGLTEVSGVCTDPSAVGRGLAAGLVAEVCRRILAGGTVPFLHVRSDNERALALYRRLGFAARRRFAYVIVGRAL
jgi:ribosomal protein S18 acetylase RimI-like enzyme